MNRILFDNEKLFLVEYDFCVQTQIHFVRDSFGITKKKPSFAMYFVWCMYMVCM